MNDNRAFRLIVIFMGGFFVAWFLNLLLNTQRAPVSVQNLVSFALAPILTTIGIIAFSILRERKPSE